MTILADARALLAHMPSPRAVETRGGRVECTVAGTGAAVLALHGGVGGRDQGLLLAMSAVGDGVTMVAPSRPGYLGTPLAAGPSPGEQADLYADILDRLGIAGADVIAVSGGGPSAIEFALRHPGRCRHLVLISACSRRLGLELPLRFHVMKLMAHWPALARKLLGRAAGDPERAARRAIADPQARAALLADPRSCALFAALQLTIADRLAQRLAGTDNDNRRFHDTAGWPLERIAVPTLAIHGTADRVVAFDHAHGVATRVPAAELMTIEGGEHVCLFTHRAAIRARVRAFLALPPG
jgi:pimeloyl-ACP methyl ester carboxylesterase